jgi:hypothetical protein
MIKNQNDRLPNQELETPMGIKLSPGFKSRLEAVARTQGHTKSSWARMVLQRAVEAMESGSKVNLSDPLQIKKDKTIM